MKMTDEEFKFYRMDIFLSLQISKKDQQIDQLKKEILYFQDFLKELNLDYKEIWKVSAKNNEAYNQLVGSMNRIIEELVCKKQAVGE